jgi:hypothetical protein
VGQDVIRKTIGDPATAVVASGCATAVVVPQLTKECSQGLGQDWSPLTTVPLYSFLRLPPYQLNLQYISLLRCLEGYKPDERNSYSYLHLLSSPMDKLSPHH